MLFNVVLICSYFFLILLEPNGGIEGPLRTWHRLGALEAGREAAAKPQRNPPARINRK